MGDLVNPYIAGAPVTEQRMFFGREDIFQWIENSITGQYADHILVIHGQRRVGKTSVLKQLGNRLPQRYIPVFFDLQGRTHTTLDRFLWWLAREIVRVLKQDHDIDLPIPDRDDFTRDVEFFENRFLPDLKPVLTDKTLLLTFDEFDNLEESEVKEELARPLVDYLRRLMGHANLNFIFSIGSSGRKLENMQAAYTEFFKSALYKKISFLNEEQTHHLITRPVEGLLRYDDKAVERIFNLASGHPYFTQLTCHELFARCQRTEQRHITVEDVEAVLDDVIERGTVNLKFVWDEASDIEKWSLAGLADLDKTDSRALADHLRRNRVRFSESDLTSGLLHLREKDILTFDNRFVIQLLRRWLQKNRPIEQVREELTEVNPIANRYIEIGLEFKDANLFDKAIESFHQALEIANDNIQAQVNIALTYMDQKLYDKAVVEFEKTLALDDEDVSARAGVCEAHLALGDLALTKGRERDAALSYQRVLAINAEHTEARGRMADIARQRAEKALTDGRDEEALSAFAEALRYTPEDEALSTRFEEVKKERREKVLSTLLVRAEKELTAKNWDSAIRTLQEGLQLSAEDERFKDRIATAKENQRAAKLESCLVRATQAEQAGKWEAAAAALQEYLSMEADQPQVQGRLEKAHSKLREIELNELRERARSFARSERWDESLTAWDAVLVQDPTDSSARSEREKVEKSRGLATSYAEAQSAFAKKDYDKAIAVFKNIVMEDSDYKEATRLLAESVELRRTVRKWWQSRWASGGIAIMALLIGAWLLVRFGLPLFTAQPASPIESETAIANSLPASPPSVTLVPIASPTPLPLVWTRLNSGQFLPRDTITTIVIDPTDAGVMYVGTRNAGIYKSIDGGASWQPIHSGLARAPIDRLVFDPDNSHILYASTYGNLFRTMDGGLTWQELAEGLEFVDSSTWIVVDPSSDQLPRTLYYSTEHSVNRSTDGGATWQSVISGLCPWQIVTLDGHPTQGGVLYATSSTARENCRTGLYRSSDGGETWDFIGLEDAMINRVAIGLDLEGNEILFASDWSGLYTSRDDGVTWTFDPKRGCGNMLMVDPEQPAAVYCRLGKSEDGGLTWKDMPFSLPYEITSIAILDTGETFLAGTTSGLYITKDAGETWVAYNSGLPAAKINLWQDPTDQTVFYAHGSERWNNPGLLYRSLDAGRNWEYLESVSHFVVDGEGRLYYASVDSGMYYSSDRGGTWSGLSLPDDGQINGLGVNAALPGVVFAMSSSGKFYYSTDYGDTWLASKDLDTSMNWSFRQGRYFFDSAGGQTGYLVPEFKVYQTTDGGVTWETCGEGGIAIGFPPSTYPILAIDPRDSNHVYLSNMKKGILVSEDGCQSWRESNAGLGSLYVNAIVIDPNKPDTIYAGTDGGADISIDGGQTWGQVNDGLLGATVVYSIVADKEGNVYAATPYGIFKLEGK